MVSPELVGRPVVDFDRVLLQTDSGALLAVSSHSGSLIHVEDSCVMGLWVFFSHTSRARPSSTPWPNPHHPPPKPTHHVLVFPSFAGCKGEVICITLLLPTAGHWRGSSRALNHGKYLHVNPRAVERASGKTGRPTGVLYEETGEERERGREREGEIGLKERERITLLFQPPFPPL